MRKFNRFAVMAVTSIVICCGASVAVAQQCGNHDVLARHLAERFSETVHATATDAKGRRVEVYRSEAATWTIVVILPEGSACILSAGGKWTDATPRGAKRKGQDT